jgi:membrane protease YdiL (CAAX protease family)
MALLAELSPAVIPLCAGTLAIVACGLVWGLAVNRWRQGRPAVPYQPRRPVPWHGIDLALVVLFYVAMQGGVLKLADVVLGPYAARTSAVYSPDQSTTEHVVGELMAGRDLWLLLLCVVSAVVAAPISEEFFFRILLQGWLEALQRRWRRQMPMLHRLISPGVVPILLTSLLFARMHFRVSGPPIRVPFLVFFLAGDAILRLVTVAFAVGWLRWRVRATPADLGWVPRKILGDAGLGLGAFAAVAAPIYALQIALHHWLPAYIAPDPLPLFFLALVLGALYYRTHRIVPLIVLHAVLNGTSLALAWLGS